MTQNVTKMWGIALDETAGMQYSVYVSGKSLLAYYSPAGNDRALQLCSIFPKIAANYSPAGNGGAVVYSHARKAAGYMRPAAPQ